MVESSQNLLHSGGVEPRCVVKLLACCYIYFFLFILGSSLADKGILNENLLSKILDSVPFASVLKSPLDLLHDIQIENVVGDSPIGSLLGGDLLKGLPTGDISGNLVGNSPVKGLLGGDPLKGLPTSRITGNLVGNSRVSGRLGWKPIPESSHW